MARQLRSAGAVCVLALALAAPARAAPFTPAAERAYNVAVRYWRGGPTDCLTLDREIVADGSLPEGDTGWATVPTEPTDCVLYVARRLTTPGNFIALCGVLVHEVGHLRGLGHSTDPASVMYPYSRRPPGICWRAGLREMNR